MFSCFQQLLSLLLSNRGKFDSLDLRTRKRLICLSSSFTLSVCVHFLTGNFFWSQDLLFILLSSTMLGMCSWHFFVRLFYLYQRYGRQYKRKPAVHTRDILCNFYIQVSLLFCFNLANRWLTLNYCDNENITSLVAPLDLDRVCIMVKGHHVCNVM